MRQLITRLTSAGAHPSFAQIVSAVSDGERAHLTSHDRVHLATCPSCANRLADVAAAIGHPSAGHETFSTAAPKLLDTLNGLRLTSVLASWLGPDTASGLLRNARTGRHAKADVLAAVAQPLTALLGEQAGSALALQLSQLAESERESQWGLHG